MTRECVRLGKHFQGQTPVSPLNRNCLGNKETKVPDNNPPVDPEVWIEDCIAKDDGLTMDIADAFLTEQAFRELPEEVVKRVTWSTRLGGPPRWMQGPDEAPKPGWKFVGQLGGAYSFLNAPLPCPAWVEPDHGNWEGRTHVATGPNLGGGLAYLFLKDGNQRPEGCMFWQR